MGGVDDLFSVVCQKAARSVCCRLRFPPPRKRVQEMDQQQLQQLAANGSDRDSDEC